MIAYEALDATLVLGYGHTLDYISELTQERSVRAESKSDRALELAPAVEPEI